MRDLTRGSIPGHILALAAPMAVGLLVQTLYYLVDLYFVSRLGDTALAGVSAAGTVMFIVLALTQVLSVGTVTAMSHAVGKKQHKKANVVFNQSVALAALLATTTLIGGYGLSGWYMSTIGADAGTVAAGRTYLAWFIPGLALQFAIAAMGAALRGTGIVKPTMIVQMLTVVVNVILTPVLVAGWGTGVPLGVAGAAIASSLAVVAGTLMLAYYFVHLEKYVAFDRSAWKPRIAVWREMLGIGLPAGGEFALMFVYMAVVYSVISDFGAAAQAGFGIGVRMTQAIFLPAMAIAFSAPAIAGQNYGARFGNRVQGTFRVATLLNSGIMLAITLLCQWRPEWLVVAFSSDAEVLAVASDFLRIVSLNFIANGLIFTCSGMFQALGNTWPALASTATRLVTFAAPAIWMSRQPGFQIEHIWYLSVVTVGLQALLSLTLLAQQFRSRLRFEDAAPTPG